MLERFHGRVVCMSSIAAEIGTPTQIQLSPNQEWRQCAGQSHGLSRGTARYHSQRGHAGDIAADISREWDEANPQEIRRHIERCPARRRGRPEDIAAVVGFLAVPEAEFVNGTTYDTDGGITSVM
jgi:NAD(P)-dependent dehydrogenase (short-subunit alcohol dehydrogenase family)